MPKLLNRKIQKNIVILENSDETMSELPAKTPSQFIFSAIVYDAIADGAANIAIKVTKSASLKPIKAATPSTSAGTTISLPTTA